MGKGISLKKLKLQNKKLQAQVDDKRELLKLEQDRLQLSKQNKQLIKEISRSPSEKVARRVFKDFRKGAFIAGKSVGGSLIRYGKFLDKQQRQNKKRSTTLKKSIRRKTTSRKIRRR